MAGKINEKDFFDIFRRIFCLTKRKKMILLCETNIVYFLSKENFMTQKSFLITLLLSGVMAFSAHAMDGGEESALDSVPSPSVKAAAGEVVVEKDLKEDEVVAMLAAPADDSAAEQEDEAEIDSSDDGSSVDLEEMAEKARLAQEQAAAAEEAKNKAASDFAAAQRLAQDQAAAEARSKEKAARKARIQDMQNQILQAEETIKASRLAKDEYDSKRRDLLAAAAEKADQEAATQKLALEKKPKLEKTAKPVAQSATSVVDEAAIADRVKKLSDKVDASKASKASKAASEQEASDLDFAQNIGNQDQIEADKKAKAAVVQASAVKTEVVKTPAVTPVPAKPAVAQASVVAKPSDKSAPVTPDAVLAQKTADQDKAKTEELRKATAAKAAADSKPGTAFGVKITQLKFKPKP